MNLRNRILQTKRLWPVAFWLEQVNISIKWNLARKQKLENQDIVLPYIGTAYNMGSMPRVYLNTPFLKFGKIGENEGVLYGRIYKQIFITQPYWFHCTFKSKDDLFLRTERRNWRRENNYDLYPTLYDYFEKKVLIEKYDSKSFCDAKEYYSLE